MMKARLFVIPLVLMSTTALAQTVDSSQYEIVNNVVGTRSYELPDARNASLLNERNQDFFRNASNLNSGTLSNSRLASDLGNRTISSARHSLRSDRATRADRADRADRATRADRADYADTAGSAGTAATAGSATRVEYAERAGSADSARYATNAGNADFAFNATNADFATRAENADYADEAGASIGGSAGGRVSPVGSSVYFSRSSKKKNSNTPNGTSSNNYSIPSDATKLLVEARCTTANNDHSDQTAIIEVKFNGSFTSYITICEAGDNASDNDTDRSAGATQFDIPSDATQVTVRQKTNGGDAYSITSGTLYWFG